MTNDTPEITPRARIDCREQIDGRVLYSVQVHWDCRLPVLDRPHTFSWSTGFDSQGRKLAERLAAAVDAGKAIAFIKIKKDIYGRTYVDSERHVYGKTMGADLKALGF